jgi:acetyl esterase
MKNRKMINFPGEIRQLRLTILILSLLFTFPGIGKVFSQVLETEHLYHKTDTSSYSLHFFRDQGLSGPLPCVVFFHGWGEVTDPDAFAPQCRYLASRGLLAVSAEYRVDKKNHFEAVRNALRAMNWVSEHTKELQVDPARIGIAGGSGGGWTAACITTVCTDLGLNRSLQENGIPVLSVLFNPRLTAARGLDETYSPLVHLGEGQPPVLIMIGTEDQFLEQNKDYSEKTNEMGNECDLLIYEGAKHAFFNYGQYENKFYYQTLLEVDKFLTKHGFLTGEPTLNFIP